MKKAYTITGWAAFVVLLLVCGAFDTFMIGWGDFFVLGGALAFCVLGSLYGWFMADTDERQHELNERRREE